MGRDGLLAAYKARKGDFKPVIEYLEHLIEDSKAAERGNLIVFRENGFRSEDEIRRYSENMEKNRIKARERIEFFANSSPEIIAEFFKAKEEEVLEELRLKWKFKL